MAKNLVPLIVSLKLSTLQINPALSGRSDKEIKENAKQLAPIMAAFGSWNPTRPGQYFMRDGKPHLSEGFTRVAAAISLGYKEGYFAECEDNPAALRIACITSNSGRPISLYEQGRVYSGMRDGGDPAITPKGQEIIAPMTPIQIAETVGYSRQHIDNCIAIFLSSPEIAELINSGKISAGVATLARQHIKDDKKRLAYLKAAIAVAKTEGKECATFNHLKAVRADHAPLKTKPTTPAPPAPDSVMPEEKDEPLIEVTTTAKTKATPAAPAPTGMDDIGGEKPKAKASDHVNQVDYTPTEKELEGILVDVAKWADDTGTVCDDEDMQSLVVIMFNRGAR